MTGSTTVGRTRWHARRLLLSLTTILGAGIAVPALAQTAPYKNVDGNGVDLTDGSFNLSLLIGSIGAGQAALPLIAYDAATTNWSAVYLTQTISGSTYSITVTQGTITDNFSGSYAGGIVTLASSRATGATLTFSSGGNYIYRYRDGSTVTFGQIAESQGGTSNICDLNNQNNCRLYALAADGRAGLTVNYNYDVHPNCSNFINPDGSINCTYAARVASVSNDAGYAINFAYVSNSAPVHQNPVPNWFKISTAQFTNTNVTAPTWPTANYAYPSSTQTTLTTPGGKVWRITNDASGRVVGIRKPSASTDTTVVSYGANGVSSVTSNGVTTSYNRTLSGSTATMVVTDAQSHTTTVVSDMTKYRPTSVTDALGHTTSLTYDGLGRPTEASYPEGNKVQYSYDGRGSVTTTTLKAKSGSGLADIATTANYPSTCTDASCNEPTWTKDAAGNQTDYTYYPATGLLQTVTAPAPSNGAARPKATYSYSTIAGVQALTSVSQCQTGASCVDTADEAKTTIAYNSNLLPTSVAKGAGDNSLTATTAITYDAVGNPVTVDGPLAGAADTTTLRYDADRARRRCYLGRP